jgi:NAD(P)-dependent dehydrogenase (short-subunit alcohol dehydrogenase family)
MHILLRLLRIQQWLKNFLILIPFILSIQVITLTIFQNLFLAFLTFSIIAVISSIAGERGRASNYVYGSAKAIVTKFISGLRQRLYKSNVSAVTIKPGFVDTPMTASFKKKDCCEPSRLLQRQRSCRYKRRDEVYVPTFW